ncbi:UPF0538 protein [Schistosoma japonicum]|uniref:UPF0538 protein n=1 Tax=Schistosoma japonicum TaxID=6182 RepID=A0A4Z2DLL3_SCHJA|nr:UPF0538 protein [Schistosoma japonicum]
MGIHQIINLLIRSAAIQSRQKIAEAPLESVRWSKLLYRCSERSKPWSRSVKLIVTVRPQNISQSTTVKELFNRIQHELETSSVIPPPFKNHFYDALKIRHKAFKTKSGDLLVDIEGDPTSSNSEETLESLGIGLLPVPSPDKGGGLGAPSRKTTTC